MNFDRKNKPITSPIKIPKLEHLEKSKLKWYLINVLNDYLNQSLSSPFPKQPIRPLQ